MNCPHCKSVNGNYITRRITAEGTTIQCWYCFREFFIPNKPFQCQKCKIDLSESETIHNINTDFMLTVSHLCPRCGEPVSGR